MGQYFKEIPSMSNQRLGYFLPLESDEIKDFSKYLKNLEPVIIKDGNLIKTVNFENDSQLFKTY